MTIDEAWERARTAEREWIEQGHDPLTESEREALKNSFIYHNISPSASWWRNLTGRKVAMWT